MAYSAQVESGASFVQEAWYTIRNPTEVQLAEEVCLADLAGELYRMDPDAAMSALSGVDRTNNMLLLAACNDSDVGR